MSDSEPVKSSRELWQRLERSDILRDDELHTARWMSRETSSAKMLARRLVAKGILTRWQAGRLLKGRERLRLGNHKLCERIGQGVSGRVFLAEHIQLRRQVAVKIFSRRFTRDPKIVDRFLEDARRSAQLNHHNLAHVLDIDNAEGRYYMVMEYVHGQDLQEVVKASGCLPFTQVLDYLCQAADGLHHAHQAGIVHGDLCPANLMRDERGVIKIVGWGVASLTDQQPLAEQPPGSTPTDTSASDDQDVYRAPEQQRGNGIGSIPVADDLVRRESDQREDGLRRAAFHPDKSDRLKDIPGDIYALGQTAGYLLTGQPPPIPGEDSSGESLRRGAAGFDWNRTGAHVPASFIEIIERMTAAEPEERFDTAEAVRVALQSQWDESAEPSLTGPGPPADPSQPLTKPGSRSQNSLGENKPDGACYGFMQSRPISAEPDDGVEVPVVSPVRTPRARNDSGEQSVQFRFGRRVVVGVVGGMALVSLLVTAVVYSFGPGDSRASGAAKGSRAAVKEGGARGSRPRLTPRRRRARSTALETSLPEAGATDGGSKQTGEDSPKEEPGDEDLDEPPGVHATWKKSPGKSGQDKKPPSSTPAQPAGKASVSDAPNTKKPSNLEPSMAADPFRQLPLAIDLPAFDDDTGANRSDLEIGSLAVSAGKTDVSLLGGTHASKGPGRFMLRTDDRQTTPAWTVLFCADEPDGDEPDGDEPDGDEPDGDEPDSEEGLEIARFRVQDTQLRFSWAATASQCAAAACLGNCVLRLSVQEHVHELRLREARTIEPLWVDLERSAMRRKCPIPAMPDRRQVRFEVTRLENPFPGVHHVNPAGPIAAHDEEVMVRLGGEELEEHVLQVTLAPRLRTTFDLECKTFFKVSPRLEWIPLTQDKLRTVANFVAQKQHSDHQQALQARTALSRLPRKSPHRAALKKRCEALEAKVAETSKASNRLEKVRQMRKATTEGAALHFRLYYLAGDREVDLVRTKTDQ
ncbi:MAG: protein kinase [Pirellulaceae bacterium]